ncbi:MAG: CARDB domain-containing protein, partial [Myxococcaceae bacterium]
NRPIPHSVSSATYLGVAAWWDDLEDTTGTVVSSKVFNTAPNREFVIDWNGVVAYPTVSKFNFQVRFFEGSSRIRISYGAATPSTASASVGIMGGPGVGVAGLTCTTATSGNCTTTAFPVSKDLEFALPADLAVGQLGGDDTAYAGVNYRATAVLSNVGGTTAFQQSVRFYLSTNTTIEPGTDPVIGDSTATDLNAGQSKTVVATGPIPVGTAPGSYWLLAKADPSGTLSEPDENNNVAAAVPLIVGAPTPDLQPSGISTTATTAVPGQTITVNASISNPGNAALSTPVKYTFLLSDNSVASYSDFAFTNPGTLSSLPAGGTTQVSQQLTLPNDLPAGRYWLGVCVDYDPSANPTSTLQEISEVNNCATTSSGFVVSSGALTVLSTSLPGASRYSPYSVHLDATGGNGSYAWSLSSGALPSGMTLTAQGVLQGSPSQPGAFGFQAQVISGQETKTQDLTLNVTDSSIPLAVAEQDLPTAEFGKAYAGHLIAIGGKPPYTWTLNQSDSKIPNGLAMASDGLVEGRATPSTDEMNANPQPFVFSVVVTDSAGVQAAREVKISVAKPTQLQVATTALQTAYITLPGKEAKHYTQRLDAIGGAGGYVWRVERFQQLAQGPTEAPGPVLTELPASLGLSVVADATGTVSLDGVPAQAGLYALTLRVRDRNGVEDATTLTLLVSYDEALAVTTTALPDAFIGRPYNARILATQSAQNVSFSAACVEQAGADLQNFFCAQTDEKQSVPAGLFLGADGTISGTPVAPSTWDGKTPQTFSFLIKAQDVQGRYDVRGLSIRLHPNFEDPKSGCSGTGMGPELFTLLLLGGMSLRRRRASK